MVKQSKTIKTKPVKERYFEARGGRKTSSARVRIYEKKSGIVVNDKEYKDYFKLPAHQEIIESPFKILSKKDLGVTAKVRGGGLSGQAGAIRHAISRALVNFNEEFKKPLRSAGFLTRDARMVERKKYGLKKARRAPQWSKR